MQKIGTNEHINLFVQIDNYGKKEVTRYIINKNKAVPISKVTKIPEGISGTTENLYSFAKDIIEKYPAKHHALIFHNHGSGVKDPRIWGRLVTCNRDILFRFDEETQLYELDKSVLRGIGFNDVGHCYLSNKDIKTTLDRISKDLLKNKKFDIIGMDACYMAMTAICSQLGSADYLVASQEIEPGYGWDYRLVLQPFMKKSLSPLEFAQQMVNAYGIRYNNSFTELTLSAVNLALYDTLEKNINSVSNLLLALNKKNKEIMKTIKSIRTDSRKTKDFLDADYIDLTKFYQSLLAKTSKPKAKPTPLEQKLKTELTNGIALLKTIVVKNSTGRNAKEAQGLSIYFPRRVLHTSYLQTSFAQRTSWCQLLNTCIRSR